MKHGSEWYKRDPQAYLGGVQGLSAQEHAVYAVVLDLIYLHGGSVNDDPKWIAGWISNMGSAAVRKTIASLIDRKKLIREGDQLTQFRAKNEAKTRENLRETAQKNGRKGGIKSAEKRAASSKNKDVDQPTASRPTQAEKTREEKSILDFLTEVCTRESAEDFIAHRKAKRAKLTAKAAKLTADKIRDHPDPDAVLRESIANGWTGVFPEKVKPQLKEKRSGAEIANRIGERWAARELDRGQDAGAVVPLLPARNFG